MESDPTQERIPPEVVERAHRGLTQRVLARAAGMAQSAIARLEGAERRGPLAQMRRLADALGIHLDTLRGAS